VKHLPNIIRLEQSKDNTTHTPAYSGKNSLLMQYLDSQKFQQDFDKAMAEKAVARC
jgi:hypothetical protein